MKKPSLPTKLTVLAAALWAVPWAWLMIVDVLNRTAIGRGMAGSVDMHEAFELVFAAAHYGIRLLGGWVFLATLWFVARYVRESGVGHGRVKRAPGVTREAVAGD